MRSPAPRAATTAPPHNLPAQVGRLFGRDDVVRNLVLQLLVSGLVLGFTVMFAAFTSRPDAATVEAQVGTASRKACVARDVDLDEGYGVTRTETRFVCGKE